MSRQFTLPQRGHALRFRAKPANLQDCQFSLQGDDEPRSGVATARIAEIRRQIADGTYLTEEKLDAAVERLCAALHEPAPRRAVG